MVGKVKAGVRAENINIGWKGTWQCQGFGFNCGFSGEDAQIYE